MTSKVPDASSDVDLARRWRSGERSAGDELVKRHFQSLRRFFAAQVDTVARRDDLIQKTFLGLFNALHNDQFEGRSSLRSYLFGIAKNMLFAHLRERYRETDQFTPYTISVADVLERSLSSLVHARDRSKKMLDAMNQLPIFEQSLLQLRYWDDLSNQELTEVFELSNDVIRARLHRARKALGKIMANADEFEDCEEQDSPVVRALRQAGRDR